MGTKIKDPVNIPALSKKYKCDVKKIIRSWKKDKGDFEISKTLGIDMLKIVQLRQEIGGIYERERQKQLKKTFPSKSFFTSKPRQ